MNVRLTVNKDSLKKIKKKIEGLKELIKKVMVPDFLNECCNEIIRRSNEKLQLMDLGENVKAEIYTNWYVSKISDNKVSLQNSSDKSIYVEFGVGVLGQENPHDMAAMAGYEYNVPSGYKLSDGTWLFEVQQLEDVDLPSKDYSTNRGQMGNTVIVTKGTPATMFVYNSVMDFVMEKEAEKIWAKIKNKYLR